MQTARICVLVGLWRENCKGVGSADGKKLCTGGIIGVNCKGGGKCRLQEIVYWWDYGGEL